MQALFVTRIISSDSDFSRNAVVKSNISAAKF